jgi:Leucine-rich repeat (LRR) protein
MVEQKTNYNVILQNNFTHFIPAIFGFLEGKQITICYLVCTLWKKVIAHVTHVTSLDKVMCELLLNRKLDYSKITYFKCKNTSKDIVNLLNLINLQTIIIRCNIIFGDDHLKTIAHMTNLQNLSLHSNFITDEGFYYIGKSNIKLKSFKFYSKRITDKALLHLNENNLKNLHTFDISNCKITDIGLIYILQTAINLHTLDIGYCRLITDESLNFFKENLRVFSACGCYNIQFKNAYKLNNLEELTLGYIYNMDDNTIKLAPHLTNLKKLDLSESTISDSSLMLIALLPNLEYLDLSFSNKIKKNVLEYINLIRKQIPKQLFIKN